MYTAAEFRKLLREQIVGITFTKRNGEERYLLCTLMPEYLPESVRNSDPELSEDTVTVLDVENGGWRSFGVDSVIEVEHD